ncbi:MAG: hypothetical protein K9H25_02475 [Rhodospirillum sp.]|nr:hypothetical protein [Rhodospirillum sp.]MCF8487995.1 hypothetical protein [Rhodospirillum sp.]MCF8500480.1 hypothetical protein [Rhodospirillum sp.]
MASSRLAIALTVPAMMVLAACAPSGSTTEYAQGYSDGCLSSTIYTGAVPTLWGFDTRALDTSADYRKGVQTSMDTCGFEPPKETLATWVPLPFADHIPLSAD